MQVMYLTVSGCVPDDPSEGFDLDGQILPHTDLPPFGGRDVENAIPNKLNQLHK